MTVAAISLPQAMAYALIAGVDPRFGLYSAIVVTLVASIFGSSSHLINGPTNAISLVVFSALAFLDPEARYDVYQATFLLALMVGAIQILIAVFKLGDLTRYISESVVLGFMAGAGCLVALGQVSNLLGMRDRGSGHQHVLERFWLTLTQGGPVNRCAVVIGVGTILLTILLRRASRRYRLPQIDMLLALVIAAGVAAWCGWSQPALNGKAQLAVVGNVPASLPLPHIPEIQFGWVKELAGSALAISCLGLLEALAIAKSIASQTRQELDYNRQCLAEGLANLTGGFFQCLPGSGSLTRSAINFQSGAVSRASGVFAAATTALAVVLFAPLARYIPKAALAGLLMVTAARLIDWKRLRYALRASHYDRALVLITAGACVFISVEFSILIGVALSILMFVPRAARLQARELVVSPERVVRERLSSDPPCTALIVYALEGELFFGAALELDRYFSDLKQRTLAEGIRYLVLRLKRTRNPDMVCLERLERFLKDMERQGVTVLLCGVRSDLAQGLKNLRFYEWLPANRVFLEDSETYSATLKAVARAYELLGDNLCPHCGRKAPAEVDQNAWYYLV
ncbi:MAG: SulP family inorganic anion transporter [Verrucomicrobia bacterium]|nr:SulP family inorganic anion transporter [Verrucomicrobiota bacterium]